MLGCLRITVSTFFEQVEGKARTTQMDIHPPQFKQAEEKEKEKQTKS
jgi:hypothetical protein